MSTPPTDTPQQRVQNDLKAAMKAKDSERLSTLRMLLSAVKNAGIERGSEVDDEAFLGLVRKAVKQRKDAADQFRKGEREELAAKEEREAAILGDYLPAQVGEAELRQAIEELVSAEGLSGPKAMGRVVPAMMQRYGAAADGATISRLAREILSAS